MPGLGVYGVYGYAYQSALLTLINLRPLHKTINCLHCSRRHICQSTGAPHFSFVFYLSPNNQMHCPRRTWTCCNISRIYTWPTTDYGSLKVDTRQHAIAASCAGDMCLLFWVFLGACDHPCIFYSARVCRTHHAVEAHQTVRPL